MEPIWICLQLTCPNFSLFDIVFFCKVNRNTIFFTEFVSLIFLVANKNLHPEVCASKTNKKYPWPWNHPMSKSKPPLLLALIGQNSAPKKSGKHKKQMPQKQWYTLCFVLPKALLTVGK